MTMIKLELTERQAHLVWNSLNMSQQMGLQNIASLINKLGDQVPFHTWTAESVEEFDELQTVKVKIASQAWGDKYE